MIVSAWIYILFLGAADGESQLAPRRRKLRL